MTEKKSTGTNKKSFILYKDSSSQIGKLNREQKGQLLECIYDYQLSGSYKTDDALVDIVMAGIESHFIRDNAKYTKTCTTRSDSGRKGGLAKQANARSAKQNKQSLAKLADTDTDIGTESDTVNEKKNKESAETKQILEHYNLVRGEMTKCLKLNATRCSQISARIKEVGFEELKSIITSCKNMPHLQGKSDGLWRADLEWITKDANFLKIREGKYIDRTPPPKKQTEDLDFV